MNEIIMSTQQLTTQNKQRTQNMVIIMSYDTFSRSTVTVALLQSGPSCITCHVSTCQINHESSALSKQSFYDTIIEQGGDLQRSLTRDYPIQCKIS